MSVQSFFPFIRNTYNNSTSQARVTDVLLTLLELSTSGSSTEKRVRLKNALGLKDTVLHAEDFGADPIQDADVSVVA